MPGTRANLILAIRKRCIIPSVLTYALFTLLLWTMDPAASQTIGPGAVWRPGSAAMNAVREQCAKGQPSNFGDCLISKMPEQGASAEAVAFSKELEKKNGQIGFITAFQESGPVDVAAVDYPLRANENTGCLLVNGMPGMIDIDQLSLLPKQDLEKDPGYIQLKNKFPRATLFPGDRSDTTCPKAQKLAGGGERFVASYHIQNGCHACERIGLASIAFDFKPSGEFAGAKFLRLEPEPAKPPR